MPLNKSVCRWSPITNAWTSLDGPYLTRSKDVKKTTSRVARIRIFVSPTEGTTSKTKCDGPYVVLIVP